jgi:peptidyl-prolyl cis-trans isomerase C
MVVARVNGKEITYADVKTAYMSLPEQYRQTTIDAAYPALVEQLVNGELMYAEAAKLGLGDDAEVQKKVEAYKKLTMQRTYLERYAREHVTEDTLRARYDEAIADGTAEEEVRARHILVDTQEAAQALLDQLNNGADFETLAKENSKDGAAANGGDLGYFKRTDVVQSFADAAFELQAGEVTPQPIQTQFGWHIIKVEDRRTAEPPTFDSMRAQLQDQMTSQVLGELLDGLAGGAEVERFNLDGTPMPAPGAN